MKLRGVAALFFSLSIASPAAFYAAHAEEHAPQKQISIDYKLIQSVPYKSNRSGNYERELERTIRQDGPAPSYQVISYYPVGNSRAQTGRYMDTARERANEIRGGLIRSGAPRHSVNIQLEPLPEGETKGEVRVYAERFKQGNRY